MLPLRQTTNLMAGDQKSQPEHPERRGMTGVGTCPSVAEDGWTSSIEVGKCRIGAFSTPRDRLTLSSESGRTEFDIQGYRQWLPTERSRCEEC